MVKPGSANNLSGQPPLAVPMGSALGDAASDLLSGYAAKRLRRPLCRSAPPSETPPAIFLAATPPTVPMGSALGTSLLKSTAATPPSVPMGSALGNRKPTAATPLQIRQVCVDDLIFPQAAMAVKTNRAI
ncbi:MAG: hypothetical protein WAV20_10375 [Blastocatellia bacterium]